MMNIYSAFAKKLFGVKYERVSKTLVVCFIVFWGLHIADIQIEIAPFILRLITATFSAGIMWQALSSTDNIGYLQNILMLPFEETAFTFSYVGALGSYTLVTKTALLWAVVFAVSSWNPIQIMNSLLCAVNAILMASVIYSMKKWRITGVVWGIVAIAVVVLLRDEMMISGILIPNLFLSVSYLKSSDGYCFYRQDGLIRQLKSNRHASVWLYLFRYLTAHKNYLVNSAAMCGVACVLPTIFREMPGSFVLPIGFSMLSLNTPLCILLSCDPALEQAVRFLPGQKKRFFVPYCIFIFGFNFCIDVVFLFSWHIQIGTITAYMALQAFFFALQSAIGSVLLEWFRPIRNWKIESDLWHHPRKYIVPLAMLLIGSLVGTVPWLLYVFLIGSALECVILIFPENQAQPDRRDRAGKRRHGAPADHGA